MFTKLIKSKNKYLKIFAYVKIYFYICLNKKKQLKPHLMKKSNETFLVALLSTGVIAVLSIAVVIIVNVHP
ncbi:hypothetical protein BAY05_14115 [Elizabethkingia anophelis]|nr:hypothetical protein BAY05_14115 [Elizabethkingia anophelis]